ncbi:MFS general substrate transporter [Phanerochaete sordida]|uniref:MFS general substrate transporter n=1 Tax=Phanerochaete sordida TaxID=48140 RepID=A0A9P3G184_9APHY|nr:MFS general substrate transporter [Phanerochaete sordida]
MTQTSSDADDLRKQLPEPDQKQTAAEADRDGDDIQTLRVQDSTVEKPPIDEKAPQVLASAEQEKPYSVYTSREKWAIVVLASVAGTFSPLTANIYFPAIPTLSNAFHESIELINLTVTMYMVLQGISPMFWGTLADRWGRRPMFMACMLVLALACVGLALVPTNAYWLLMLLRCLQAAGSASTIALGAGVIADIADRSERGGFFGLFSLGPMVGPCLGPVIGGALSQGLGWRAIFWFLCIGSALCFVVMLLILPETLRSLVGDGSILPPPLWRPLLPVIGRGRAGASDTERPPKRVFQNPLRIFLYPDVTILLVYNATLYAVFYGVTASISTLFSDAYPFLSETDIGLCFLAIGGGMLFGSWITGTVLDREYQRVKRTLERRAREDPEAKVRPGDVATDEVFPIEYARFRTMPAYFVVYTVCCAGYGWCLQAKVNLAGPLILQIIIGYTIVSIMNTTQTLLVDLLPNAGSSVTACNNLVRCSFGAACVSVIDLIIKAIGVGWTYILLAGLCVLVGPLMFVIMYIGPRFRAKRRARQARQT